MTGSEQDRAGVDEIADRVMAAVGRRLASFEERMASVEERLRDEVAHVRAAVQVVDLLADDVRRALTEPPAAEDIVLRRLDALDDRLRSLEPDLTPVHAALTEIVDTLTQQLDEDRRARHDVHRAIDALDERLAQAVEAGRADLEPVLAEVAPAGGTVREAGQAAPDDGIVDIRQGPA